MKKVIIIFSIILIIVILAGAIVDDDDSDDESEYDSDDDSAPLIVISCSRVIKIVEVDVSRRALTEAEEKIPRNKWMTRCCGDTIDPGCHPFGVDFPVLKAPTEVNIASEFSVAVKINKTVTAFERDHGQNYLELPVVKSTYKNIEFEKDKKEFDSGAKDLLKYINTLGENDKKKVLVRRICIDMHTNLVRMKAYSIKSWLNIFKYFGPLGKSVGATIAHLNCK